MSEREAKGAKTKSRDWMVFLLLGLALVVAIGVMAFKNSGTRRTLVEMVDCLVAEQGAFDPSQSGIMYDWEDDWLDPNGVLSATILDFDGDGENELLVCATEPCPHQTTDEFYHVVLSMYEVKGKTVVLADSMVLNGYLENLDGTLSDQAEPTLRENSGWNDSIIVNALPMHSRYYLLCEYQSYSTVYTDGSMDAYWMLEYQDEAFRYVCSFPRMGPSSSE